MNIDMKNANFFIGRIGSVEVKTIGQNETKLLKLSVVQDDGFMRNGNWQEEKIWVDVEAFNGVAEYGESFCQKGQTIGVSGKLRMKSWTDDVTGADRQKLYLLATSISRFMKPANGDNTSQGNQLN